MKKQPSSKDEQDFIILKRLARLDYFQSLRRIDFERPDTSVSLIEPGYVKGVAIPHSSLFNRIKQLVRDGAVEEVESGDKSKKYLPIMEYNISIIGLIQLLRLCYGKKFQQDIFENLNRFTYIQLNIETLLSIFSKEQLFETLVNVCHNTIIDIDYDPFSHKSGDGKYGFLRMVTGSELLHKKDGMIVYYTFIEFPEGDFSYMIWERTPLHGNFHGKKGIFFKPDAMASISETVSCAFFHELILRCSDHKYRQKKYSSIKGKNVVLEIIRRDPVIQMKYIKFLQQIDYRLQRQIELFREIKESI